MEWWKPATGTVEEAAAGDKRDSLQYLNDAVVQQLGIKYSPAAQDHHRPLQQLGRTLTVGPLDVHVHPHPDAAHHGLHVVRHLHLLAAAGLSGLNLDLTSLWSRLTNPHLSHSLNLSSLTSFKTGPLTARCKELTH